MVYPADMKTKALQLYTEGLGFCSIGRFLGVSNVRVLNRIKALGKEVKSLHSSSNEIEIVELDKILLYRIKKTTLLDLDCC